MAADRNSKVVSIAQLRQTCRTCSLRDLCLPLGLGADDMQRLESIVHVRGPIRSSEHLFREGDSFQALYAVKNGALKTYTIDSRGREHVLGFHIAGELVGLDGIHSGHNRCNAVALQATSVCALPYTRLEQLIHDIPGLQAQVLRIFSREVSSSAQLATDHSAEERLAGFLLSFLRRYARRGLPSHSLSLPMPRRDIANHLRLATETVSRLLARFQDQGLIRVSRRDIKVLDAAALESLGASFDLDGDYAPRWSPQSR